MAEYETAVRAVREVGPDTVAVDLAPPADFDGRPGQFVLVRVRVDGDGHPVADQGAPPDDEGPRRGAETVTRAYTISSPSVDERVEITVGVDPTGDLSPWLAGLESGDVLPFDGPFGEVYYDPDEHGDAAVLAGGPGVGPAVAVAEAARAVGHDAAVVYEDETPAHIDRLEALAAGGARVAVVTDADVGATIGATDFETEVAAVVSG
ncbi:MAG: FAD-dependent oxidoreductase, partial [Halobacteriales archaeon]